MLATPQQLQRFARQLADAGGELAEVRARLLAVLGAGGWAGPAHDQFLVAGQAAAARLDQLAGRCDDLAGRTWRLAQLLPLGAPPGLDGWPPGSAVTGAPARSLAGAR